MTVPLHQNACFEVRNPKFSVCLGEHALYTALGGRIEGGM